MNIKKIKNKIRLAKLIHEFYKINDMFLFLD
jgi:hypothetical protein